MRVSVISPLELSGAGPVGGFRRSIRHSRIRLGRSGLSTYMHLGASVQRYHLLFDSGSSVTGYPQLCLRSKRIYEDKSGDDFLQAISVRPTRPTDSETSSSWYGTPPSDALWYLVIAPCRDPDPQNRPNMDTVCRLLAKEASQLPGKHPFLFQVKTAYFHNGNIQSRVSCSPMQ
jgi:hypothetical protein